MGILPEIFTDSIEHDGVHADGLLPDVRIESLEKAYDPNQPRAPKGSKGGGRWTKKGGVSDAPVQSSFSRSLEAALTGPEYEGVRRDEALFSLHNKLEGTKTKDMSSADKRHQRELREHLVSRGVYEEISKDQLEQQATVRGTRTPDFRMDKKAYVLKSVKPLLPDEPEVLPPPKDEHDEPIETIFDKRRKVIAAAMLPFIKTGTELQRRDLAEAGARKIGIQTSPDAISLGMNERFATPQDRYAASDAVHAAIQDHLKQEGMQAEQHFQERVAGIFTEHRSTLEDDHKFAAENWRKSIKPEQVSKDQWVALAMRRKAEEVDDDLGQMSAIQSRLQRLIQNKADNPNFAAERQRLVERAQSPEMKAVTDKYLKTEGLENRRTLKQAIANAGEIHTDLMQVVDHGYGQKTMEVTKLKQAAYEEHVAAAKRILQETGTLPEDLLRGYRYDEWVPKELKNKIGTDEALKKREQYMHGGEFENTKQYLDRAMRDAEPELRKITSRITAGVSKFKEAEDAYNKAHTENQRLSDAKEALRVKLKVGAFDEGKHLSKANKKKLRDAREAYAASSVRLGKASQNMHDAAKGMKQDVWNAIAPAQGNITASLPGFTSGNISEANSFLQKVVSSKIGRLADVDVKFEPDGFRAQYSLGTIQMPKNTPLDTIIHEYGHHIDHANRNAIAKLSKAFSQAQIEKSGEKPQHMGAGYEPEEIGAKDGFQETYSGKYYDGDSSEVISMGLQHLYQDPVRFYRNAPDHFKFTIAALHGLLS